MLKKMIREMVETPGLSGHEQLIGKIVEKYMLPLADECRIDGIDSLTTIKRGYGDGSKKIMLAGHMDEIGLMVKLIDENGFIQFTNIGGVDQRTLLVQEVIVHGSKDLLGIIGNKPPHILSVEERSKSVPMKDMLIDLGLPREEVIKYVSVGDPITINRKMIELQNGNISAKALDDRAGVAVMYECLKALQTMKHECDVYATATSQEEVGYRGAKTSTYKIQPQIGIAIDVGFGHTPELSKDDTSALGDGPAICFGGSIHPKVFQQIMECAKENNISVQDDITPGACGTDAWGMQIAGSGVATGLISIPLRYMHTSVETINLKDVKQAGKLLAHFIVSLNNTDLEEWLCF